MTKRNAKLEMKRKRLSMYYEAEEAILGGAQSYAIGSRNLTRANLDTIRAAISALEDEVAELESMESGAKPRKAVAVVPRDY